MITPLGKCPICGRELSLEGPFLVCPAGDYKTEKKRFSDRWDQYHEETREGVGGDGLQKAKSLLRDLQEMNILKESL